MPFHQRPSGAPPPRPVIPTGAPITPAAGTAGSITPAPEAGVPQPAAMLLRPDQTPPVIIPALNHGSLDHFRAGQPVTSKGYPSRPTGMAPFVDAFTTQHPRDLYATMYGVQVGDGSHLGLINPSRIYYRLSTAAPQELLDQGWISHLGQIQGWGFIIEGDLKDLAARREGVDARHLGKVPWDDEWRAQFPEIVAQAAARFPLIGSPTLFFTSRNGYRLVYCFSHPLPVLGPGGHMERLRTTMAQMVLAGLPVDRNTKDWTRLQRLPAVIRENVDAHTQRTTYEPTWERDYFRLSWGRIDLGVQELIPPPEGVTFDPEEFSRNNAISLRDLEGHPEQDAVTRILLGSGDGHLEGIRVSHAATGEMPDDEEVSQLLYSRVASTGGRPSPNPLHNSIRERVRRTAKRESDEPTVVAARSVWSVLWDGRSIDRSADGTSNLHDNCYRLMGDLCWLAWKQLGPEEHALNARMLYAFVVGPARAANEARDEHDGGRRSDEELCDEVWRMACDVFRKKLGRKEQDLIKKEQEEQETRELRAQFSEAGDVTHERLIAEFLKEQLGVDDDWCQHFLHHHLIISSEIGKSIIQIRDGEVRLSTPVAAYHNWITEIRNSGHRLIGLYEVPRNPEDEPKLLREAELMNRHGTSIGKNLRASRLIAGHTIEPLMEGGERHIRLVKKIPGVAEDVAPVYHPVADEFLRIFAGDHYPHLVDWLSCYSRLDLPLPALYLEGDPGTGKTLVAESLRRLTATKKIADFSDAVGNFQDEFEDTLLIGIDEDTGCGGNFSKDAIGVIRRMIGGNFSNLKIKYTKGIQVDGEWRLLITANNQNVISSRQNMSHADLEAIRARIFHLPTYSRSGKIRDFFRSLGGRFGDNQRMGMERMDFPGMLAEHVMWLAGNHHVQHPGTRFAIAIPRSPWHDQVGAHAPGAVDFCRAIAEILEIQAGPNPHGRPAVDIYISTRCRIGVSRRIFESFLSNNFNFRSNYDEIMRSWGLFVDEKNFRVASSGKLMFCKSIRKRERYYHLRFGEVMNLLSSIGYDYDFSDAIPKDILSQIS